MNQQQLILTNQEIQNKLADIIQDVIDEYLREDEDIQNELDPLLQELDPEDYQAVLNLFKIIFPNHTFMKSEKYQFEEYLENQKEQNLDFKFLYRNEMIKDKNWQNFIKLLKIKKFCSENRIPDILSNQESICLMQKLKDKLFKLFELYELILSSKRNHKSFIIQLLNMYCDQNEFSDAEQIQIDQVIGNILTNKIYEFLEKRDSCFTQNNEQLILISDTIQNFQLKNISYEEILTIDKQTGLTGQQLQFLRLMCEQNIKEPKLTLNYYFSNLLQIKFEEFIKMENKQDLLLRKIDQLALTHSYKFEECYFRILIYYWIQNFSKLNQNNEITTLEEVLKGAKLERKSTIMNRYLTKVKKLANEELHLFIIHTFIFYTPETSQWTKTQKQYNSQARTQKILEDLQETAQQTPQSFLLNDIQSIKKLVDMMKSLSLNQFSYLFAQNSKKEFFHLLYFLQDNSTDDKLVFFKSLLNQQNLSFPNILLEIEKQKSQLLLNGVIILLNLIGNQMNIQDNELSIYRKSYYIFENFKFASTLQYLYQTIGEKQCDLNLEKRIEFLSKISRNEWKASRLILGNQKLLTLASDYLNLYLTSQPQLDKSLMFQFFLNIIPNINPGKNQYLGIFSILLKIFKQKKNLKLLHYILQINIKNNKITFAQFQTTLYLIFKLLKRSNQKQQDLLLCNLNKILQNETFDFDLIKAEIFNKTEDKLIVKMLLIQFMQRNNDQYQFEQLFTQCEHLYNLDNQLYERWMNSSQQFSNFKLSPYYLSRYNQYECFPQDSNITLQDFNISLSEMEIEDQIKLIKAWVNNMNDQLMFKQLIPFFFNIIKRGDDAKKFIQLINLELEQQQNQYFQNGFNMKALFQILYNNSDYELKVMLLKFQCKLNPVPFLYQNQDLNNVKEQEDIYILNEKLFYVFPKSLPIINFSLNENQTPIGKTKLINQIFYQMDKFEILDMCEMNRNTIDIIFDFSFSGSRQFSVADVHGFIPIPILEKILYFFKIWIIQLDTESEMLETFHKLQILTKNLTQEKAPIICIVIRNSNNSLESIKQNSQYAEIFKLTQNIHCVIDLTKKNLSQGQYDTEIERFQKFIYGVIELVLKSDQQSFVNQQNILEIIQKFNTLNQSLSQEIEKDGKIMQDLEKELTVQIEKPNGFYSITSFPLRSIEWSIKNLKDEQYTLVQSKENLDNQRIQEINQEIHKLENNMSSVQPTHLLNLFCELFRQSNNYILYLSFADKIRQFNEINTYEIQDKIQTLNESLSKLKTERNALKKNNDQITDETIIKREEIKEKIKKINDQLSVNLQNMALKNLGIELFWRELIAMKQKCPLLQLQINPVDVVYEMIKKGEPFEFLDGDQLKIDQKFLTELTDKFSQSGEEKVLVLSVLGPQSSGKSTILNKIFGCHFWTSVGRCTKGIYLQLLRIQQKRYFDDLFDYILILDSEGLQNPNQIDPEFDKKIALFVLAISDIILINVKGDIHSQFKNLVEMCIFTLGQLKSATSSVKSLSWCFNQNGDVNNLAPFLAQIQGIATSLSQEFNKTDEDNETQNIDYNQMLDINKENIKILGFAQTEKSWKKSSQSFFSNWRQLIVNETFSEEAYEYGVRIIKNFVLKRKQQGAEVSHMPSLHSFIQNIDNNWQSICRLPDLLEFTELIQYKQDDLMKKKFQIIYDSQEFDFIDNIQSDIQNSLSNVKQQNMQICQDIQKEQEAQIIQKLDQIKEIVKTSLLQIKQEHQISKKILIKYENRLSELMQTQQEDCKLTIFNEIKSHETKFQENGFLQIDNQISAISENITELQKLQKDPKLIIQNFQIMWNNITDDQLKQMKTIFDEFCEKQYKSISSSFTQFKLSSKKESEYQQYFIKHINKNYPFLNQQSEKEKIMKMFQYELMNQQFQILDGTKNINVYGDIFGQPILDRLSSSSDEDILNLNVFYKFQLTFYYFTNKELFVYLKNQFFDDFISLFRQNNKLKNKGQQHIKSAMTQFFNIFFYLNIQFDQDLFNNLITVINDNQGLFTYIQKVWKSHEERVIEAFKNLQNSLYINTKQIVLNDKNFFKDFTENYKHLIIFYQTQDFPNYTSLQGYLKNINYESITIFYEYKITPIENSNFSLEYVAYQNYQANKKFFLKEFIDYFSKQMNEKQGWNKLYFELYDLIVAEMRSQKSKSDDQFLQQSDSDDDICQSNVHQITLIMSKIKLKIDSFNRQFAKFGVTLNPIGERCIYYYSMFLIWRFSCYKKWKILQDNHEKLNDLYDEQLKKFTAEILQNKVEQSRLKAKSFAATLYATFIENYYKDNLKQVISFIEGKSRNCDLIMKEYDTKLLENYSEKDSSDKQKEVVIKYITEQKEFFEDHANSEINKIQEELGKTHQNLFYTGLGGFLQVLFENIKLISNHISNQKKEGIKTVEYFEKSENDKTKDIEFEQKLFLLFKHCILREGEQNPIINKLKKNYSDIFKHSQYKEIPCKMNLSMKQQSDQEIQLLKPYVEELLQEIETYLQNCKQEKLSLSNFDMKKSLDKIKLNMIGCLVCCPLCKRKCDQPNDNHDKHQCKNGHQLRGMNFVLIDDKPSLYTCEEITDDMLITTQETKQIRKWKEIKQMHKDWDFSTLQTASDLTQVKNKMMNVWNGGVGQLICNILSMKYNKKIQYIIKHEFEKYEQEKIHFIFMLDDSGSMSGQKWNNSKNGALTCMSEIEKNPNARISCIIFNSNARVVIDCEKVDIQTQHAKIDFESGGTSFERAFQLVFDQIQKHKNQNFERNVILFYTDGGDSYPKQAINRFIQLPQNERKIVSLVACSEESNPSTLSMMVGELSKNGFIAELKTNIKLGAVQKVWTEVVLKGVHVRD